MKFGLFTSAQAHSGDLGPQGGHGFGDYLDFNVAAERLGFHSSFSVEHHFSGWNQVSSTLMLLTALAMRTTRLRLGSAVMVLPWHNPVLLAEQAATLDLLSGGRLDLGIGKGYRHSEFKGFQIAPEEAEARFDEAVEVMIRAQYAGPELIAERIALYRAECKAHGFSFDPMRVAVARQVYVATDQADKEAALRRQAAYTQRTIEVSRMPGRADGGSHVLAYADTAGATEAHALYGVPDEIRAKLANLEQAGACYVLLTFSGGVAQLQRFAREIMPSFSSRADTAQAAE